MDNYVKKPKLLLFVWVFLVSFSVHLSGQQKQPLKSIPEGDFNALFRQTLKDSKDVLMIIKSFVSSFGAFLQQASYLESSKIEAIKRDPNRQNKGVGLIIDFSYQGSGPLGKGYQGVMVKPVMEIAPPYLQDLFSKALELSCKQLFNGRQIKDPITQQMILGSSPFVEFMFKMVLLAKAKSQKKIDKNSFNGQLFMLMYRLSITPGSTNVNDLFKRFPAPLKSILNSVKIQKKPLKNFLQNYFIQFQEIKNYDFSRVETTQLKKRDMGKVIKILSAIFLRAAIDYLKAYDAFVQTDKGKLLALQIKNEKNLKKIAAFAQQVPGYETIVGEMQDRLLGLVLRLSMYKKIKNSLKTKLAPLINPLLALFGLSLDDVLPPDDQLKSQEAGEMPESELDSALGDDSFLGDSAIDEIQASDIPDVSLPEETVVLQEGDVVQAEASVIAPEEVTSAVKQVTPEVVVQKPAAKVLPEKLEVKIKQKPAATKPVQEKLAPKISAQEKPPAQPALAAATEVHPIDLLDDCMDAYDTFDQQGLVDQAASLALEKRLMDAALDARDDFETYDTSDLADLGYALLDADSYLEDSKNRKEFRDFFLLVKKTLAKKGFVLKE